MLHSTPPLTMNWTIILSHAGVDKDLDEARGLSGAAAAPAHYYQTSRKNVINEHYKFVDGTSFASPIVASIVACMLEANPKLTPQQIKRILIDTAERVAGVEVERQGWGVVVPRKAVEMALRWRG
jgi:serine protease AprX